MDELPSIDKQKITLWGQWGADLKQRYLPYSTLEHCALTAKAHWIWMMSKPKGVWGRCFAHCCSVHCSHKTPSPTYSHTPHPSTLSQTCPSLSVTLVLVLVICHSFTSHTHRTLVCPRAVWIRWNRSLENREPYFNEFVKWRARGQGGNRNKGRHSEIARK